MTNYGNKRIKEVFALLRWLFGGKCCFCGSVDRLEFAHKRSADGHKLAGWGRGRKERAYNVLRNYRDYFLACHDCHKKYDAKTKTDEPKVEFEESRIDGEHRGEEPKAENVLDILRFNLH